MRTAAALVGASASVGGLVMVISSLAPSRDPAAKLAATLGLGSGAALAALLGGLFGGWLVFGGSRRVAATTGTLIGIAVIVAAWELARPHAWVVDLVMNEILGQGANQYSPLVLILIAIPLFRAIAGATAAFVAGQLARRSD